MKFMAHNIKNCLLAILIISSIFLSIIPQADLFSKVTQLENIESSYSSQGFSMSSFGADEDYILLYGKPFRILGFNYMLSDSPWKPLKEYNWSKVRFELSLGRELGANTIRVFIDYEYAVGNPNYSKDIFTYYHVDQEYLNAFEKLLNICNEFGYKVIVTLDPGYWEFYKPQNRWVVMKFLEEFIASFINDRTIIAWDLMNEPDVNWNVPGAPSIEEHLELLKNMALKIRELDKLHLITIGWGRVENAGYLADYVDFISFHYYGINATQELDDVHDVGGLVKIIRKLRKYGKPLVLSEFGWPVVQELGWDEDFQAKIYDSILHNLLEYESVAGVLFWTLVDFNQNDIISCGKNLSEARFGVYTVGYSPRQSAGIVHEYFHKDSVLHFYEQHYDLFEVVYETLKSPNSDPRLLGLGVDYVAFIDDRDRILGFIDVGKSEYRKYLGYGWFAEERYREGDFCWAGGKLFSSELHYRIPIGTKKILIKGWSIDTGINVRIYINKVKVYEGIISTSGDKPLLISYNVLTENIIETESYIIYKTSTTLLVLNKRRGELESLINLATWQELRLHPDRYPSPWLVWLRSRIEPYIYLGIQADTKFTYTIDKANDFMILEWMTPFWWPDDRKMHKLHVNLWVGMDHLSRGIRVNGSVNSDVDGLMSFYMPFIDSITGIGSEEFEDLVTFPLSGGYVIRDAVNSLWVHPVGSSYPGPLSVQFIAWYEEGLGGFYFGLHDSEASVKTLELFRGLVNGSVKFAWNIYSKDFTKSEIKISWPIIIAGYRGLDWREAALIYRRWAEENLNLTPLRMRSNIPEWLLNVDVVWRGHSYGYDHSTRKVRLWGVMLRDIPSYAREVADLLPALNVLLTQWTGWNRDGFDKGYPEYFPAVEGDQVLKDSIRQVKDLNFRFGLYFNGRLIDTETATYAENKDKVCISENGEILIETTYSGMVKNAVADPTTNWWRNLLVSIVGEAMKRYGDIDEIYLDQITLASPCLWMSKQAGGGSLWINAERAILKEARDTVREYYSDAIITSEGVNEAYIGYVDMFKGMIDFSDFSNNLPKGFTAPIFSFIYHRYAIMGGNHDMPPDGSTAYIYLISEAILRGAVPAAFTGTKPISGSGLTLEDVEYLYNAVLFRRELKDFLLFGEHLTPPVISSGILSFSAPYLDKPALAPALGVAVFHNEYGDTALILSNRATRELNVTIPINYHKLKLDTGKETIIVVYDRKGSVSLIKHVKEAISTIRINIHPHENIGIMFTQNPFLYTTTVKYAETTAITKIITTTETITHELSRVETVFHTMTLITTAITEKSDIIRTYIIVIASFLAGISLGLFIMRVLRRK
jgi:hypothetical protein